MEDAGCESEEEERKEDKQEKTFMFRKYEMSGRAGADSGAQGAAPHWGVRRPSHLSFRAVWLAPCFPPVERQEPPQQELARPQRHPRAD